MSEVVQIGLAILAAAAGIMVFYMAMSIRQDVLGAKDGRDREAKRRRLWEKEDDEREAAEQQELARKRQELLDATEKALVALCRENASMEERLEAAEGLGREVGHGMSFLVGRVES